MSKFELATDVTPGGDLDVKMVRGQPWPTQTENGLVFHHASHWTEKRYFQMVDWLNAVETEIITWPDRADRKRHWARLPVLTGVFGVTENTHYLRRNLEVLEILARAKCIPPPPVGLIPDRPTAREIRGERLMGKPSADLSEENPFG